MATLKDVANLAGVSIATVSNYLNNTKPVSKEISKKYKMPLMNFTIPLIKMPKIWNLKQIQILVWFYLVWMIVIYVQLFPRESNQ